MPFEQSGPSRRALLVAAALLPLAGCDADDRSASASSPTPDGRSASSPDSSRFAALERKHGARLGVYALATSTGVTVAYRADERFAFCSTFKTLAAAAVLHPNPLSHLDKRVTYTPAGVNSISPITKDHIATGMTIRQLCDAAILKRDTSHYATTARSTDEIRRRYRQAFAAAEKLRAGRPDIRPVESDFERGMWNGKLSALRWVLGDDWDFLDTRADRGATRKFGSDFRGVAAHHRHSSMSGLSSGDITPLPNGCAPGGSRPSNCSCR